MKVAQQHCSKKATCSVIAMNNKIPNKLLVQLCSCLFCILSVAQETQVKQPGEGLKLDTVLMNSAITQIQNQKSKLHSMLLIHNDELLVEAYFNDHQATEKHDLRSATKSIISLLIGIAIDKGIIKSVQDPIHFYLKNSRSTKNETPEKNDITIAHLLTMSAGLDCNDWDTSSKGQEDKVYRKKDWIQYTLNLPMVAPPGTKSAYCSMGVVLLAEILQKASGMRLQDFAKKYLFNAMDIKNLSWGHTSSSPVIDAGKRLYMTSRDLAKIGQLILHQGNWNGKQLVSKEWIQQATSKQTTLGGLDYGYLWWNIPFKVNGKTIPAITATGNGGQYIMVFPELNFTAVFTGGAYNSEKDKAPFYIINNVVLPSLLQGNSIN